MSNHMVSMKWIKIVVDEAWEVIERRNKYEERVKKAYDDWQIKKKEIDEKLAVFHQEMDREIYERDFIPLELSDYIFYCDPRKPELIFEQDDNLFEQSLHFFITLYKENLYKEK